MNILKEMVDNLVVTKTKLDNIGKRLKEIESDPKRSNEWELLYEQEFMLSVELSGLYSDIKLVAKRIKNEDNELEIKRLIKRAEQTYKPLTIEM